MKLQNAVGAVGRQIEGLTGKVGIIVAKYRERRDGLSQLANTIQQEIGQVGWESRGLSGAYFSLRGFARPAYQASCLGPPGRGSRNLRERNMHFAEYIQHCAVGLPEFAL